LRGVDEAGGAAQDGFRPQTIANTLWAFATLGLQPGKHFPSPQKKQIPRAGQTIAILAEHTEFAQPMRSLRSITTNIHRRPSMMPNL